MQNITKMGQSITTFGKNGRMKHNYDCLVKIQRDSKGISPKRNWKETLVNQKIITLLTYLQTMNYELLIRKRELDCRL